MEELGKKSVSLFCYQVAKNTLVQKKSAKRCIEHWFSRSLIALLESVAGRFVRSLAHRRHNHAPVTDHLGPE